MSAILTGRTPNQNVKIFEQLGLVSPFKENMLRRLLYPITVLDFISIHGNRELAQQVYSITGLNAKTRINSLNRHSQALLRLHTTLSKSKDIIFDLAGLGPENAQNVFNIVAQNVKETGSAILLDWAPEMRNQCTTFVEVEKC